MVSCPDGDSLDITGDNRVQQGTGRAQGHIQHMALGNFILFPSHQTQWYIGIHEVTGNEIS